MPNEQIKFLPVANFAQLLTSPSSIKTYLFHPTTDQLLDQFRNLLFYISNFLFFLYPTDISNHLVASCGWMTADAALYTIWTPELVSLMGYSFTAILMNPLIDFMEVVVCMLTTWVLQYLNCGQEAWKTLLCTFHGNMHPFWGWVGCSRHSSCPLFFLNWLALSCYITLANPHSLCPLTGEELAEWSVPIYVAYL